MFKVVMFETNEVIARVASEAEARALFSSIENIDCYDAEDGPGIARYEEDGEGCFIVDGTIAA